MGRGWAYPGMHLQCTDVTCTLLTRKDSALHCVTMSLDCNVKCYPGEECVDGQPMGWHYSATLQLFTLYTAQQCKHHSYDFQCHNTKDRHSAVKSSKKEATVGRQVSADIFSLGEARYQFRVGLISLKNLLLSKRLIMFRAIQLNLTQAAMWGAIGGGCWQHRMRAA